MSLWRKRQLKEQQEHGVYLDWETADKIAVLALKDYRELLQDQLESHKQGSWMHPDDVVENKKCIKAINRIMNHFGGDLSKGIK